MRNEWCDGPDIPLHGATLEHTESSVLLGRELRIDGSIGSELLRRKRAAWAAYSSIREVTSNLQDAMLPEHLRHSRPSCSLFTDEI